MTTEQNNRQGRAGRPTSEDAGLLTERILDSALLEFEEYGLGGSTLERIAARSGTTRRSVTARYASINDVLVAVASRELTSQRSALSIVDPAIDDPLDRLRDGLWRLMKEALTPRALALYRICAGQMYSNRALSQAVAELSEASIREIALAFVNAQNAGHFTRHSARQIAKYSFSIVAIDSVNRAIVGDQSYSDPVALELHFSDAWSFIVSLSN